MFLSSGTTFQSLQYGIVFFSVSEHRPTVGFGARHNHVLLIDQDLGKVKLRWLFSLLQCLRVTARKVQRLGWGVEWNALGEEITWRHFHSHTWLLIPGVSWDLNWNTMVLNTYTGPLYGGLGFLTAWQPPASDMVSHGSKGKWENQGKAAWLFLI